MPTKYMIVMRDKKRSTSGCAVFDVHMVDSRGRESCFIAYNKSPFEAGTVELFGEVPCKVYGTDMFGDELASEYFDAFNARNGGMYEFEGAYAMKYYGSGYRPCGDGYVETYSSRSGISDKENFVSFEYQCCEDSSDEDSAYTTVTAILGDWEDYADFSWPNYSCPDLEEAEAFDFVMHRLLAKHDLTEFDVEIGSW